MAIQIYDACELKNKLAQACNKLVVIQFCATWCGPSRLIEHQLDDIAYEYGNSIVVLKVEVDDCSDIADSYNVKSVPLFVFIKRSKKISEYSGASACRLRKEIARLK